MATAPERHERSRPDWGEPPRASSGAPLAAAFVYAALAAAVAVAVGAAVDAVWPAALVLLACGALSWHAARGGARLLRDLGARPVAGGDHDHARTLRLVSGIADDLRIQAPDVWSFEGGSNALVTVASGRSVIAVAASLERDLALTELEAVIAHCLVRLRGGFPGGAWTRLVPGWTRRIGACAAADHDVRTAALTRYPPGLARAIGRAEPVGGSGRGSWFVPEAAGACSPSARSARLEDL